MKLSNKGIIELISHEAIVPYPYKDSEGNWTFGIGHTSNAGPPSPEHMDKGVKHPFKLVLDTYLDDLRKFESRVNDAFKVPLKQHQFEAAVSFDFNTGRIHDASWVDSFNEGNIEQAKKEFMWYKKPTSIIPRREKERDLFFHGIYSNNGYVNIYPANANGSVLWSKGKRLLAKDVLALLRAQEAPETAPSGKGTGLAVGIGTAILALLAAVWRAIVGG